MREQLRGIGPHIKPIKESVKASTGPLRDALKVSSKESDVADLLAGMSLRDKLTVAASPTAEKLAVHVANSVAGSVACLRAVLDRFRL